jgi:itaconate CoA-transferase
MFCNMVLERPEVAVDERFLGNARRVANRAALTQVIEDAFSTLSADEVVKRLDSARIANGKVNDVHSLATHPQLEARRRWRPVATPQGDIQALLPPANLDDDDVVMGSVPAVGEHTAAVLGELGLSPETVSRLQSTGAI